MVLTEYTPAPALQDYIDAYWVRRVEGAVKLSGRRVYADGCADIFLHTGNSIAWCSSRAYVGRSMALRPGHIYLGGTMTSYGVMTYRVPFSIAGHIHWLILHPLESAIGYGLLVWIIMNLVVVPLSRALPRPSHPSVILVNMLILMLAIGLPAAYGARLYYRY